MTKTVSIYAALMIGVAGCFLGVTVSLHGQTCPEPVRCTCLPVTCPPPPAVTCPEPPAVASATSSPPVPPQPCEQPHVHRVAAPAVGVSAFNKGLPSWQNLMVRAHAKLRPQQSVFGWWLHDTKLQDAFPEAAAGFQSYRDIGNAETDDKTLHHRYDLGYAQLFEPIRALDVSIRLLEIGLGCTFPNEGASVRTWGKYYPSMNLTMVEFNSVCANAHKKHAHGAPKGGWQFYLADGTKKTTARRVLREANNEKFDIVLEDASHFHQHQIDSFTAWWPLLKVGGVYVVEDLHTSFMGGGYGENHPAKKDGVSFFNYLNTHVHGHPKGPGEPWGFHWQHTKFPAEPIGMVQCYWSMCFVHKASDEEIVLQDPWKYSGTD